MIAMSGDHPGIIPNATPIPAPIQTTFPTPLILPENQSGAGTSGDKKDDKDKKKYELPIPTRVSKKKRKLPYVIPHTRCRLKWLKLEQIKDFLFMEE